MDEDVLKRREELFQEYANATLDCELYFAEMMQLSDKVRDMQETFESKRSEKNFLRMVVDTVTSDNIDPVEAQLRGGQEITESDDVADKYTYHDDHEITYNNDSDDYKYPKDLYHKY
jgi:hypothetical protein